MVDNNINSHNNNEGPGLTDREKNVIDVRENQEAVHFPVLRTDEEVAAEITVDERNLDKQVVEDHNRVRANSVTGWIGIALSVLSLFFLPIVFGVAGIILGFIARSRDAVWLGNIAIVIGIFSIIMGLFVRPFVF